MMVEEDSRPAAADAAELRAGMRADSALLRRFAARGLGRLEDPAALPALEPLLDDPDPAVRAQAANAVAQAVYGEASPEAAAMLRARLATERDARARGVMAMTLGRLQPVDAAAARTTLDDLVELTRNAPPEALMPTMRGIEWLVRTNADAVDLAGDNAARLVALSRYGRSGAEGPAETEDGAPNAAQALEAARVRRLAIAALRAGGALDGDAVETALYDPDIEVRRLAAAAAADVPQAERVEMLLQIALADAAGPVRYEGLGGYARRLRETARCAPIAGATDDADPHVALRAIDLLASCDQGGDAVSAPALLTGLTAGLAGLGTEPAGETWHRGAHALVALARRDPEAASPLGARYADHPIWQVRMYAARAAAITGDVAMLRRVTGDPHPNVAHAALRGLTDHDVDAAAAAAVALLDADEIGYELVLAIAAALTTAEHREAVQPMIDALARLTEQRRETSRDPRMALLEAIGELGNASHADAIRLYLRDFDPRVAAQAAETLTAWTGEEAVAQPQPLPLQPFPPIDDLLALQGAIARIEMVGGGVVEIELYPFEAPANVARFVRQARSGYFEGLTFHRVVPNFVVQGGSPGANEYAGDGPYTRDEVGMRPHLSGTVGISTRGRDTGDSQIFINVVDNVRLDHAYTIIGTVVAGMEAIDAALEGAVIERVTIVNSGEREERPRP
jgi:cyclophilin family peptidyl-prolyl cis-trans isomerase/HEAT repeat protein